MNIAKLVDPDNDETFYALYDTTAPGLIVTLHAGNQSEYTAPEDIYAFPLTGSTTKTDWPADHAVAHAGIGRAMP